MDDVELAYSRWSRISFPLPTVSDVEVLEDRLGLSFPSEYRRFLLGFNGGFFDEPRIVVPDVEDLDISLEELHGIGASHPCAELASAGDLSIFDDNDPLQVLPIGSTVSNYLIILITRPESFGEIILKTFDDYFFLATDIFDFFSLLRER